MTTYTIHNLPRNWDTNVEGFGRPFIKRTLLQKVYKYLFGNVKWF